MDFDQRPWPVLAEQATADGKHLPVCCRPGRRQICHPRPIARTRKKEVPPGSTASPHTGRRRVQGTRLRSVRWSGQGADGEGGDAPVGRELEMEPQADGLPGSPCRLPVTVVTCAFTGLPCLRHPACTDSWCPLASGPAERQDATTMTERGWRREGGTMSDQLAWINAFGVLSGAQPASSLPHGRKHGATWPRSQELVTPCCTRRSSRAPRRLARGSRGTAPRTAVYSSPGFASLCWIDPRGRRLS